MLPPYISLSKVIFINPTDGWMLGATEHVTRSDFMDTGPDTDKTVVGFNVSKDPKPGRPEPVYI